MDANKIAEDIVNRLFTNGLMDSAKRLVLEGENGERLGGWCREAVRSQIMAALLGEKGEV